MYKKVCLCIVILFLSISTVVASDNITDDDVVHVDGDDFISIQDAIDNSNKNSIIELNGTYKGEGYTVNAHRDITLQGSSEGAVLDAENKNDAFYFYDSNVTLKNLEFINVPESSSAFRIEGDSNLTVINCSFDNVGIGVMFRGNSLHIINCSFNNVSTESIFSQATDAYINNSIFTNHDNGIFSFDFKLTVENSIFKNAEWSNIDASESGEVYLRKNQFLKSNEDAFSARILSNKSVISDCIFNNGGSVSVSNVSDIVRCNFTKSYVAFITPIKINVKNSRFIKDSSLYSYDVLKNVNIVNNVFDSNVFEASEFNGIKFINNTVNGNFVYSKYSVNKFNVMNSQFLNNNFAKSIFDIHSDKVTIHANVFSNNTCKNILDTQFFDKSTFKVTNNIFSGNFNKKGELAQIKAILYDEEFERGIDDYYTVVYTATNITNNFLGFNLVNKYEINAIPQVQYHDTSWVNVAFKQIGVDNGTYTYSLSFVNPKGNAIKLPAYSFKIKDKKTGEILIDDILVKSGTSTFTYDKKITLNDIFILTAADCVVNRPKATMAIKRTGSTYDDGSADIVLSYQNAPISKQVVYVEIFKKSNGGTVDHYFKTNAKGIVDLREYLDVVGSPYTVKAYSASKDFEYCTATIKNVKVTANKVIAKTSKVVTTYKSGKTLNVKVINSKTKKPIKGCYVSVVTHYGKYSFHDSGVTDSNGWARVDVSVYKIGTFKVTVNPDDGNHKGKAIKTKITIKKAKCSVSVPKTVKKSSKIQITLKNKATKKPNKNVRVAVKLYSGKSFKTYKLITNSKGIILIDCKKLGLGKHNLVVSSNDRRYTFSTKTSVKIIK